MRLEAIQYDIWYLVLNERAIHWGRYGGISYRGFALENGRYHTRPGLLAYRYSYAYCTLWWDHESPSRRLKLALIEKLDPEM